MTDKRHEDDLENLMADLEDRDKDDEHFYSETAYNEYYYREKEQEEIREIHAEIEDKERREQEELEEYLLSLSPREYVEWKREYRKQIANSHPLYDSDTKETIVRVNKIRYPFATDGDQIRATEEQIMSEEEKTENFAKLMDTVNNKSIRRPVSSETHSVNFYEDNCDQLQKLCESTGQTPGEALRDLVDEALRARRNALIDAGRDAGWIVDTLQQVIEQNRQLVELNHALVDENRTIADRSERVLEACEDIEDHADALNHGLKEDFRVFYALLLQTLFASLSSRRMAWNYVARTVLEASGVSEEEITRRYKDEVKAAVMEGNNIAKATEESVERMSFPAELDIDTDGGTKIEDNEIPF